MSPKKICMIFTEGSHDTIFIKKIIKNICNTKNKTKFTIADFPEPLKRIYLARCKALDFSSSTANVIDELSSQIFLPSEFFEINDCYVMIFKTGGKDNIKPVKTFLYEFYFNFINKRDTLLPFNNRENIKPLFIRDADDENFINVTKNMQNTFFPLEIPNGMGKTELTLTPEDAYFYVWHGPDGTGTLEDIIVDIVKKAQEQLFENSSHFVSDNFPQLFKNNNSASLSKQRKATITCAGQGLRPGCSLRTILENDDFLKDKLFNEIPLISEFTDLLKNILNS